MNNILANKLHEYIAQNNPDVLIALQENNNVTGYLTDKVNSVKDLADQLEKENTPGYIIEELCMDTLTKDLKPSKFNYIRSILEENFESIYKQLRKSRTLVYEVMNLIDHCKLVFESQEFTEENENSRQLSYSITAVISEYFESNQW